MVIRCIAVSGDHPLVDSIQPPAIVAVQGLLTSRPDDRILLDISDSRI